MTAPQLARYLLDSCKTLEHYDSYMFGSTLKGVGNDIDLLIVGPDGAPLKILKEELRIAGDMLPLDILYMLPVEAFETNFVEREGCISLAQLSKSSEVLKHF